MTVDVAMLEKLEAYIKGQPDFMWTPAVLGALAKGDLENAKIAGTPGGIEAQERAGQKALCASAQLPIAYGYESAPGLGKAVLMEAGVKFGRVVDNLFQEVVLPKGWAIQPTDHTMHSKLIDATGRTRARIFYKAAFYDRKADIKVTTRYGIIVDSPEDYDAPGPHVGRVVDGDIITVWQTDPIMDTDDYVRARKEPDWARGLPEPQRQAVYDGQGRDRARKACKKYLDEHFPEWNDEQAYW